MASQRAIEPTAMRRMSRVAAICREAVLPMPVGYPIRVTACAGRLPGLRRPAVRAGDGRADRALPHVAARARVQRVVLGPAGLAPAPLVGAVVGGTGSA